jgi:hypothetical protein
MMPNIASIIVRLWPVVFDSGWAKRYRGQRQRNKRVVVVRGELGGGR